MRPARAWIAPRPVQPLLPVLVPHRPRAAAHPAAASAGDSAPLHHLRATNAVAGPRAVPCLLSVPVCDRPRAPRALVAAVMDPPEGYIVVACPVCGHGYPTLQAAPAPFCSVACADAAHRLATPPPEPPHIF